MSCLLISVLSFNKCAKKKKLSQSDLFVSLGPVVLTLLALLMLSLSTQFVNYISTSKANTLLFFVEKMLESFAITVYLYKK